MLYQDLSNSLPVHPTKRAKERKLESIKQIVVHCTDWNISPEDLTKYDLGPNHISSTGCPTCTYHYLVGKDGTVSKAVDPKYVTWHAGIHNNSSVSIALLYKTDPVFESGKTSIPKPECIPPINMMNALGEILTQLCLELKIEPTQVFGHREMIDTGWFWSKGHKVLRKTCPGMAVNMPALRDQTIREVQQVLKDKNLYLGSIDGDWGPRSQRAFKAL